MTENSDEKEDGVPLVYSQRDLLLRDVVNSCRLWRFWVHLGWEDIAKQYRRSFLGPIWISINTALFVIAFGFIGAQLFKFSVDDYLPYFCTGNILFSFISSLLVEGCHTFTAAEPFLKQTPYPKFAFAMRVVWRNVLMFLHNLPILLGVLLWVGNVGRILPIWFLAGFFITALCASMLAAIIGAVSARFRDVPMIINSVMQIAFFITPVMWRASQVTERAQMVVYFNPLAAFLDIMRAPLLGHTPSNSSWYMVALVALTLLGLFFSAYLAARRRIVYWI